VAAPTGGFDLPHDSGLVDPPPEEDLADPKMGCPVCQVVTAADPPQSAVAGDKKHSSEPVRFRFGLLIPVSAGTFVESRTGIVTEKNVRELVNERVGTAPRRMRRIEDDEASQIRADSDSGEVCSWGKEQVDAAGMCHVISQVEQGQDRDPQMARQF